MSTFQGFYKQTDWYHMTCFPEVCGYSHSTVSEKNFPHKQKKIPNVRN